MKIKTEKTSGAERWWSLGIESGSSEYPGCKLTLVGFGWHVSIPLPPIVRPYRHWVDTSQYDWSTNPAGGYWDEDRREYGVSIYGNHFSVRYGRQADDSSIDKCYGFFLPWDDWRHVRHSVYDLNGAWFADTEGVSWERRHAIEAEVPKARFRFADFDGEEIEVETYIEERQWKRGTKWCKWLSLLVKDRVSRSLSLRFSKEVGPRKGSWKGGVLGHGITMLPGELHLGAFKRYCTENQLTFLSVAEPTEDKGD